MSYYTPLELLAHKMCNEYPHNVAEGWNWWNVSDAAQTSWLNIAHDHLMREAKARALEEAAEDFGGGQAVITWLRDRAQQLRENP